MSTGLRVDSYPASSAQVVRPVGVLSNDTYGELRDGLLKCAAQEPAAMVVDLDGMRASVKGPLAVFPSVWLRISDWPGVPMVLAVGREPLRGLIESSNISGFVPVYRSVAEAMEAVQKAPLRYRRQLHLGYEMDAGRRARRTVEQVCEEWGVPEITGRAMQVACELVENVYRHARSEGWLRLELRDGMFSVAVADQDSTPPRVRPPHERQGGGRGLVMVAELSRAWGHAPRIHGGKVVWAVLTVPDR